MFWLRKPFSHILNKTLKIERISITVLLERVCVVRVLLPNLIQWLFSTWDKWSIQCERGKVCRGSIMMSALCPVAVQNKQKSGLTKHASKMVIIQKHNGSLSTLLMEQIWRKKSFREWTTSVCLKCFLSVNKILFSVSHKQSPKLQQLHWVLSPSVACQPTWQRNKALYFICKSRIIQNCWEFFCGVKLDVGG